MTSIRRPWAILLALAVFPSSPCLGGEAAEESVEYSIKAAFLLNFTKFIEWPATAFDGEESPIIIGVLGKDPFGPALDRILENKSVGKRKFEVRRFASVKDLQKCHLLFVAAPEVREDLKKALEGKSVVTVADFPDFADKEGIIQFAREENKIRFRINIDNARAEKLKISSSLLRLARAVISNDREPEKNGNG